MARPALGAILARVLWLAPVVGAGGAGCATDTTTTEARGLVAAGARLIDVRARYEYAERHVPGAINIPVEELAKRAAELGPRDRPVVVYCHTGVRAGLAARMLRRAGFRRVHNLGSLSHWYQEAADPPVPLF